MKPPGYKAVEQWTLSAPSNSAIMRRSNRVGWRHFPGPKSLREQRIHFVILKEKQQ